MSAAQSFLEFSTARRRAWPRVFGPVLREDFGCDDDLAHHAAGLSRQHFLKQDTVFFDVLVYSGCSAFRFPGCTQRLSHLTTLGGQHGEES
jgi:hypothetical protein